MLVVSWVVGITAGVFQAVPMLLGACILALLALAYYMRLVTHILVAIVCLGFLGFLYGNSAVQVHLNACQGETASYAVLDHTYAVSAIQAQYVFKRNDGCSILVSTTRFPLLVRGTEAQISGAEIIASPIQQDDGVDLILKSADVRIIRAGNSLPDNIRIAGINTLSRLLPEPDAGIAIAMVLGDRGGISPDTQEAFRMSGISHVLAISGLHVSILIGVLAIVVRIIPVSLNVRSLIMISVLWIYIQSIGMPVSAVRAGVFWTLYVLAYRARALIGMPTVLIALFALLATITPRALLLPGLQLSVMAVSGIFLISRLFRISSHPIASLFMVSLGATLGTLPLVIFYFQGFSVISILVNMFIVPIVPLLIISIVLVLCCSALLPPIALMFSFSAHVLFSIIFFITSSVQHIPYAYIDHLKIPGWSVFAYYACLIGVALILVHRRGMRLRELWI